MPETNTETVQQSPVVIASESSWRCVQAGDKAGWLALMADDIVIEDPIGEAVTNPDGNGIRGKEAVGAFFDANIGPNQLTVTREETFPSSSPTEIAYILVLRTTVPERVHRDRAWRVHLQGQRRRTDHEPARLLEHGRHAVRPRGRRRLANRWPVAAPLSSAALAASVWRWPSCWPSTAQAWWSTDATPMRQAKRLNAFPER